MAHPATTGDVVTAQPLLVTAFLLAIFSSSQQQVVLMLSVPLATETVLMDVYVQIIAHCVKIESVRFVIILR